MTYENGNKYEGILTNDIKNGLGKMTYSNGEIYEGNWKDDKKTGTFKITKNSITTIKGFRNNKEFTKENKNKLLSKFTNLSKEIKRAMYLSTVCNNDFEKCLSLGIETNKINEFFNYYIDFKYLNHCTPLVVNNNSNGIIHKLEYSKKLTLYNKNNTNNRFNTYNIDTILKTEPYWIIVKKSDIHYPDSLLYEYYAGLFINNYTKIFPCFCETYGIYKSDSKTRNTLFNTIESVKENLILINDEVNKNKSHDNILKYGCKNTETKIHILIQYIKNASTFNDKYNSLLNASTYSTFQNLIPILYQIYLPLSVLGKSFTHYDLHGDNILLQYFNGNGNVNGTFIKFNYHITNTKIISFNSYYLVKIIDYGRCYFNDVNSDLNSENIIEAFNSFLEKTKVCTLPSELPESKSSLTSDFMLFDYLKKKYYLGIPDYLTEFLKKIYKTENETENEINVITMVDFLGNIIESNEEFKLENQDPKIYATQLGILDVYVDKRPMKYTHTPPPSPKPKTTA